MKLNEFVVADAIVPDLKASSKEDAIRRLEAVKLAPHSDAQDSQSTFVSNAKWHVWLLHGLRSTQTPSTQAYCMHGRCVNGSNV